MNFELSVDLIKVEYKGEPCEVHPMYNCYVVMVPISEEDEIDRGYLDVQCKVKVDGELGEIDISPLIEDLIYIIPSA